MAGITLPEILEFDNRFYETYYSPENVILATSPELVFINAICSGEIDKAVDMFDEMQQFGDDKSSVDAPQGRFEGKEAIRTFCENWLNYAQADASYVVPVVQTRSGGRSCTEMVVHYQYRELGKTLKFPICVVGDLREGGRLDEIRIYFFFKWLPGISAYRHRIFKPSHNEQAELNSMCNVIREYIDALTNLGDEDGMERILATMNDDVIYGGYRPESISPVIQGKDRVAKKYESFIGMPQTIRFESIIDNDITAVCEWVGVPNGRDESGRVPLLQSGVGIYDRDPATGKLKAVRIIDNFRFQHEIDWDKVDIRY